MEQIAFKMKLFAGFEQEYKRRHNEIWPELSTLLKGAGITDYSIFLDKETNILIGVLKITDKAMLDTLPANAVMQKWWAYMSDIMESNPDYSPVSTTLEQVFNLP